MSSWLPGGSASLSSSGLGLSCFYSCCGSVWNPSFKHWKTRSALFCDNSENVQSITRRRRDRDPDIYTVSCPPPARQYCPDLRQSSLTGPTSSGQLFYYWVFWNDILWIGSQLDYTLPNTPTPSVEPPPPLLYNSVQVEAEDPPPAYESLYRQSENSSEIDQTHLSSFYFF